MSKKTEVIKNAWNLGIRIQCNGDRNIIIEAPKNHYFLTSDGEREHTLNYEFLCVSSEENIWLSIECSIDTSQIKPCDDFCLDNNNDCYYWDNE